MSESEVGRRVWPAGTEMPGELTWAWASSKSTEGARVSPQQSWGQEGRDCGTVNFGQENRFAKVMNVLVLGNVAKACETPTGGTCLPLGHSASRQSRDDQCKLTTPRERQGATRAATTRKPG